MLPNTTNMPSEKNDFWTTPSLRTASLFGGAWLLSTGLLLVAATDSFQYSFFRSENLLIGILWLLATRTTARVGYRYFRRKRERIL
jgi:hypothetical protein